MGQVHMTNIALAAVCALFFAPIPQTDAARATRVERNIGYVDRASADQTLDLYLPRRKRIPNRGVHAWRQPPGERGAAIVADVRRRPGLVKLVKLVNRKAGRTLPIRSAGPQHACNLQLVGVVVTNQ